MKNSSRARTSLLLNVFIFGWESVYTIHISIKHPLSCSIIIRKKKKKLSDLRESKTAENYRQKMTVEKNIVYEVVHP